MPQNVETTQPSSRILLVSGSELTNRSIGKLLGDRFDIRIAADGESAWRSSAEQPDIDLIISQLVLAVEGGLIERLRRSANPRLKNLPVLVLIGEGDSVEVRDQAFIAGATDFIYAPFSRIELETRAALHTRLFQPVGEETTTDFTATLESLDMLNTVMQRDYFVTRLSQELAFCDRHRTYLCVAHLRMLDSDSVIDRFGQPVFAALVRTMAHEIDKQTRAEDSVAYLGGAGFALQLPVTNGIGAHSVLARLMQKLAKKKLRYHGESISVNFCTGLYVRSTRDSSTVDQIMDELETRADLAERMGEGHIASSGREDETEFSVEQALNKLRYDQVEGLDKQVSRLLQEVQPLLQFALEHDEIGFEDLLESIKDNASR